MRVAMVSEHASPLAVLGGVDSGGQNVHVASLAGALAGMGVEVVVYTRRDDARLPGRVDLYPDVTVEHVNAGPPQPVSKDLLLPYMDAFADRLHRSWQLRRPDVVHAHFWMSGRASLAAAAPLGIPVVQTFHALGVVKKRHQGSKDTSPPQRLDEESSVIQRADRILATCSDELFELVRLGAEPHRISVIPCGVDLRLFRPDGPALPRPAGIRRIVVISRLVERKGIGNVISALSQVPATELLVAGGPDAADHLDLDPMVARFRALAREEGVSERVEFLGAIDRNQVPNLIRSADVVACVPWYEPFGMVALEAMHAGVPVIGSAVGGVVEIVQDGRNGFLVPPGDDIALSSRLEQLLTNAELQRLLRAGALATVDSRFFVTTFHGAISRAVCELCSPLPGSADSGLLLRRGSIR